MNGGSRLEQETTGGEGLSECLPNRNPWRDGTDIGGGLRNRHGIHFTKRQGSGVGYADTTSGYAVHLPVGQLLGLSGKRGAGQRHQRRTRNQGEKLVLHVSIPLPCVIKDRSCENLEEGCKGDQGPTEGIATGVYVLVIVEDWLAANDL